VLVGTTHPGNVGAAARAMRAMGLRRLVLAAPRDPGVCRHVEALARASRADDVLAAARIEPDLRSALVDSTIVIAVSAEPREFGPQPQLPQRAAQLAHDELVGGAGGRVSFVFGCERTGLSIEDVGLCQALCSIPGEDDYASLNLAQAVQVIAWCLRAHSMSTPGGSVAGAAPDALATTLRQPATHAEVEAMFVHLERALVRIGFLDPGHPKKLMPRLRRLFARTRLEVEEVAILRGICTQIERQGECQGERDGERDGERQGGVSR
jgi:tRNA/rRNA methyltransferase